MRKFMGSLLLVTALSFLGVPSAMADDPTPSTTTNDKDPKHRRHHRHHCRHHHHRHHKHTPPKPESTPGTTPSGTNT